MVNTWSKGFLWYSSELVKILHQYCIVDMQPLLTARPTFGSTSLNHGLGDSNSANQFAVADPTSLARLWISQSLRQLREGLKRGG